jgi:hypothetical protein
LWLPPRREWLAAAGLLATATAWVLRQQILAWHSVPDLGDPLFSMWRLSTIAHQLATDPLHLFDGNIYHPAANTLAYSDAILLPGLLAAPFLWAGVPVASVYTGLVVFSFLAAGLAMFLAVRTLTGRFSPALLAALIFACYPYRFSSYSHIEKLGTFFMPVAFLLLWRVLQHGRRSEALALGLTVTGQALWSLYLGAFLMVTLTAVTVVRWAAGHFRWRERARGLVLAGGVAAVILIPYSVPYWQARTAVGERDRGGTLIYSASRADLVTITPANRLHGSWLPSGVNGERHLFPGLSAVALSAAALVPPFSPLAGAAGAGLLTAVDGAFGLNGATFTWLYDVLPPFRAFRAPGRFSAVAGLFVSLLAGLGLHRLLGRHPNRRRRIVASAIILFAVFELQVDLKLEPVSLDPPQIYSALPDDGRAVLINLPVPDIFNMRDFQYIYHSTFHHRRIVNGSSGFIPPDYGDVVMASDRFPDDDSLETFRRRGVDFVLVHADFYDGAVLLQLLDRLANRSDVTLVATRPSPRGRADRLYRLR